jgi:hypothetical protein
MIIPSRHQSSSRWDATFYEVYILETEDGDNQNTEDNQLSLRKIEGAAFRGIRNGLDKINLVSENDDMAKLSVLRPRGRRSHGSLLNRDVVSLGLAPEQTEQSMVASSQKRVPREETVQADNVRM